MSDAVHATPKYRAEYQPPAYLVDAVELHLDIHDEHTDVTARLQLRRNPQGDGGALWLDGVDLELLGLSIDDQPLAETQYRQDAAGLRITTLPDACRLEVRNRIHPDANTALEGFYRSGDILTTQCEATGFRHITFFPDRPDVLARYRVRLTADTKAYPVLLANGDCVAHGEAGDGRHYATWEDPYPKPCYLFAAVAGDLAEIADRYRTGSGREIAIRFFTEQGNEKLCGHAIDSLKKAMAWDEATYGLEYDLDTYMVVAVGSFNMGAMENKGLNIFNTSCILASPDTATDRDFATVRDVVAHEYFHNYTGNRVTCRDWFQLSLKESLTVFREQQFAADHDSPGVMRIEQARLLRNVQFPEDSGPTAHPVRPESYIEMNNFYTITIYQKGAEVIRMMHTLLGDAAFNAGVRHYLDRHDGEAVTIEDFVTALEDSSGRDLAQFRLWYSQAGTPRINVTTEHDSASERLTLTLAQHVPATPGQGDKQPMHIPVAVARVDADGRLSDQRLLELREAEQQWHFEASDDAGVISVLRDFSAPVKLSQAHTADELMRLMRDETDAFARWDAAQQLALGVLIDGVNATPGASGATPAQLQQAFAALLDQARPDDDALLAEMLTLPSEAYVFEQFEQVDILALVDAHAGLKHALGQGLAPLLSQTLAGLAPDAEYHFEPEAVGRRRLAAVCLDYLAAAGDADIASRCLERFEQADNMTDCMSALNALNDLDCGERDQAMQAFEQRWQQQPLVLDKWFALQATSRRENALDTVRSLLAHPCFDLGNPNRVRALLGSFARGNLPAFHRADGAGYAFIADQVLALNSLNPQIAARLTSAFSQWRRHRGVHREQMQAELLRIRDAQGLSSDVAEIVAKTLEG